MPLPLGHFLGYLPFQLHNTFQKLLLSSVVDMNWLKQYLFHIYHLKDKLNTQSKDASSSTVAWAFFFFSYDSLHENV